MANKVAKEESVVKPLVRLTKVGDGTYRYGDGSAYPDASKFEDADVIPVVFVEKQADGNYAYVDPSDVDVTWSDIQGKPSTFPPSSHTHAITDVNGLQSALDSKAAASHTHSISQVSGLQSALDSKLTASQAEAQADSTAEDVATLVADFNALLAKLRAAGIMAE